MATSTSTPPAAPRRPERVPPPTDVARRNSESDTSSRISRQIGPVALTLLRLALGLTFLWAFLDKTLGLGYATPSERAWVNGGSPTEGFLAGVQSGPLQGTFNAMAGAPLVNWLFMLGLLGIGVALLLGVVLRIAAASGALLLLMMWFAAWPPASMAGGEPTGSNNPLVDDHIISALAIIVVGAYAVHSSSYLGRWWANQPMVRRFPWLR
jgi:thiosulfate dehydrogenase [quinone] large subunit